MKLKNKRKLITSIILVITIVSLLIVNYKASNASLSEKNVKEAPSNTPTTFKMIVKDFYGDEITNQTNASDDTKTSNVRLYSITEGQFDGWLMENSSYGVNGVSSEIADRSTAEVRALRSSFPLLGNIDIDNKSAGQAQYGETKELNSLFNDKLEVGKYYALYNSNYHYSWEIEGLSEYRTIGSSLYFKYENGAKLTAIYYDYNLSDYNYSAVINTNMSEYSVSERIIEEVAYIVKDEAGNYVVFDNINGHLIYKGKSTEKYVITNINSKATLHNMPNGKYYVTQITDSNRYQEENVTKELVINNTSASQVTYTNIFNDTRLVIMQQYVDPNGPKTTKKYNVKIGSSSGPYAYYIYKGLDENGYRVYDYTPVQTDDSTAIIEVDYITIINHIPAGMVYTLQIYNDWAGAIGSINSSSYYQSLQLTYSNNFYLKSQVYNNAYGMKKYTKTNIEGTEKVDAKFYISPSEGYKYIYKKHDKMTYDGEEYKNVYEIIGLVSIDEENDKSIIESKNGEFYLYYPLRYIKHHLGPQSSYGDYKKYDDSSTELILYEAETDKKYILTDEALDYSVPKNITISGNSSDYNGSNAYVERKITSNYEELKEENNADVNIVNLHTPSITKEIKNDKNSTFKFDLYEGELESTYIGASFIEEPKTSKYGWDKTVWEFEDEGANYYEITFTPLFVVQYGLDIYDENDTLVKSLYGFAAPTETFGIAASKIKIVIAENNYKNPNTYALIKSYNRHGTNYEKIKEIEVKANETVYLEQLIPGAKENNGYLKFNKSYIIKEQLSEDFELINVQGENGTISLDEEENSQFEFIFGPHKEVSVTFTNNSLKEEEPEIEEPEESEEPEIPIIPSIPNANTADYIITFIILNVVAFVIFTTGTIVLLKKKNRYTKIG